MSEPVVLAVLTAVAVVVGIVLGGPLARWQMRIAGRPSQTLWTVLGVAGTLAVLNLAGISWIPIGALVLTAAAASVIAIRRELRRQGRI